MTFWLWVAEVVACRRDCSAVPPPSSPAGAPSRYWSSPRRPVRRSTGRKPWPSRHRRPDLACGDLRHYRACRPAPHHRDNATRRAAMFEHIIVPLDGTTRAEAALSLAAALARKTGTDLVLVSTAAASLDRYAYLEKIVADLDVEASIEVSAKERPAAVISRRQREHDPALVVMATHGHRPVGTAVLGSVGRQVVGRGHGPVMLIGPHYSDDPMLPTRIVVPLDGSASSEAALPVAEALGAQLGAPVHLLAHPAIDIASAVAVLPGASVVVLATLGRRGAALAEVVSTSAPLPETDTFTAIMGPSGSGKSTLLHCIAGLDSLTSGRAFIGDADLSQLNDRQLTLLRRDHVGFVFQAYNLVPTLTAIENITLPLMLAGRKGDKNWIDQVVATMGLTDRLQHRPSELSGGQQQRVAVARALASRPEIIFADEPTGNLDSRAGAEVLSFMRRAVDEMGQTIVMVTHDPVAASYADRIIFLADGRIVDEMERPTADRVLDRMKRFGE